MALLLKNGMIITGCWEVSERREGCFFKKNEIGRSKEREMNGASHPHQWLARSDVSSGHIEWNDIMDRHFILPCCVISEGKDGFVIV